MQGLPKIHFNDIVKKTFGKKKKKTSFEESKCLQ